MRTYLNTRKTEIISVLSGSKGDIRDVSLSSEFFFRNVFHLSFKIRIALGSLGLSNSCSEKDLSPLLRK